MKPLLVAGVVLASAAWLLGAYGSLLLLGSVVALLVVLLACFVQLDNAMFVSIPVVPPPASWSKGVDDSKCSLFRFLPMLRGKVAWRPLGVYPTPTDAAQLTLENGSTRRIFLKREDKASDVYSGNKLRTLEFQLACAAAAAAAGPGGRGTILSMGASGSNQVVAVATHVQSHPELEARLLLAMPEARELENGLNAYSGTSLTARPPIWQFGVLPELVRALFLNRGNWRNVFVSPPGGANVAGALGHIAAVLEVAETQPDLRHIVLPMGSGCTTAGIIVGVAVARHLGMGFARIKRIFSVAIHPLFSVGNAFLMRNKMVPRLVEGAAACIAQLGGPDVRGEAMRLMREVWRPIVHHCGQYGAPTPASLRARELRLELEGGARGPWLCHTFSSKAMAFLAEALGEGTIGPEEGVVFWCTKTLVQPARVDDVFERTGIDPVLAYIRGCTISSPRDFYNHPNSVHL
jgi:hypothetical protein